MVLLLSPLRHAREELEDGCFEGGSFSPGVMPLQASEQNLRMSQSREFCSVQWKGRLQVLQSFSLRG